MSILNKCVDFFIKYYNITENDIENIDKIIFNFALSNINLYYEINKKTHTEMMPYNKYTDELYELINQVFKTDLIIKTIPQK